MDWHDADIGPACDLALAELVADAAGLEDVSPEQVISHWPPLEQQQQGPLFQAEAQPHQIHVGFSPTATSFSHIPRPPLHEPSDSQHPPATAGASRIPHPPAAPPPYTVIEISPHQSLDWQQQPPFFHDSDAERSLAEGHAAAASSAAATATAGGASARSTSSKRSRKEKAKPAQERQPWGRTLPKPKKPAPAAVGARAYGSARYMREHPDGPGSPKAPSSGPPTLQLTKKKAAKAAPGKGKVKGSKQQQRNDLLHKTAAPPTKPARKRSSYVTIAVHNEDLKHQQPSTLKGKSRKADALQAPAAPPSEEKAEGKKSLRKTAAGAGGEAGSVAAGDGEGEVAGSGQAEEEAREAGEEGQQQEAADGAAAIQWSVASQQQQGTARRGGPQQPQQPPAVRDTSEHFPLPGQAPAPKEIHEVDGMRLGVGVDGERLATPPDWVNEEGLVEELEELELARQAVRAASGGADIVAGLDRAAAAAALNDIEARVVTRMKLAAELEVRLKEASEIVEETAYEVYNAPDGINDPGGHGEEGERHASAAEASGGAAYGEGGAGGRGGGGEEGDGALEAFPSGMVSIVAERAMKGPMTQHGGGDAGAGAESVEWGPDTKALLRKREQQARRMEQAGQAAPQQQQQQEQTWPQQQAQQASPSASPTAAGGGYPSSHQGQPSPSGQGQHTPAAYVGGVRGSHEHGHWIVEDAATAEVVAASAAERGARQRYVGDQLTRLQQESKLLKEQSALLQRRAAELQRAAGIPVPGLPLPPGHALPLALGEVAIGGSWVAPQQQLWPPPQPPAPSAASPPAADPYRPPALLIPGAAAAPPPSLFPAPSALTPSPSKPPAPPAILWSLPPGARQGGHQPISISAPNSHSSPSMPQGSPSPYLRNPVNIGPSKSLPILGRSAAPHAPAGTKQQQQQQGGSAGGAGGAPMQAGRQYSSASTSDLMMPTWNDLVSSPLTSPLKPLRHQPPPAANQQQQQQQQQQPAAFDQPQQQLHEVHTFAAGASGSTTASPAQQYGRQYVMQQEQYGAEGQQQYGAAAQQEQYGAPSPSSASLISFSPPPPPRRKFLPEIKFAAPRAPPPRVPPPGGLPVGIAIPTPLGPALAQQRQQQLQQYALTAALQQQQGSPGAMARYMLMRQMMGGAAARGGGAGGLGGGVGAAYLAPVVGGPRGGYGAGVQGMGFGRSVSAGALVPSQQEQQPGWTAGAPAGISGYGPWVSGAQQQQQGADPQQYQMYLQPPAGPLRSEPSSADSASSPMERRPGRRAAGSQPEAVKRQQRQHYQGVEDAVVERIEQQQQRGGGGAKGVGGQQRQGGGRRRSSQNGDSRPRRPKSQDPPAFRCY